MCIKERAEQGETWPIECLCHPIVSALTPTTSQKNSSSKSNISDLAKKKTTIVFDRFIKPPGVFPLCSFWSLLFIKILFCYSNILNTVSETETTAYKS